MGCGRSTFRDSIGYHFSHAAQGYDGADLFFSFFCERGRTCSPWNIAGHDFAAVACAGDGVSIHSEFGGDALSQWGNARGHFLHCLLLFIERQHIRLDNTSFHTGAAPGQQGDVYAVLIGVTPCSWAGENVGVAGG